MAATTASSLLAHTATPRSEPLLPSRAPAKPRRVPSTIPPTPASVVRFRYGLLVASGGCSLVPKARARTVDEVAVAAGDARNGRPIVVVDNYDSFTYNLCQYIGELGAYFEVYRNDELTVEEMKRKNPRAILISPGPGTPQDSGISLQTVLELGPTIPMFGVCMGLQCMAEAFGGKIVRSPYGVMHGKSSLVCYDEKREDGLFCGLPNPFTAGRYHSLVIEKDSFPSDALEITAWTDDGLIMAARHKMHRHIQGVQFHPESIMTTHGRTMVRNFIKLIERMELEA